MNATMLAEIVGLLVSLSVASERLVEIIKNLFGFLRAENPDAGKEGWRRAILQVLAVGSGIVTAVLARPAIEATFPASNTTGVVLALGLLASGGSGFWNAVLAYVLQAKNIKKELASQAAYEASQKLVELANKKLEHQALAKAHGLQPIA